MAHSDEQSAAQAVDVLMKHGPKGAGLVTFRAKSAESAAEAVKHLASRLADVPPVIRESLENGRNSAAMLSADRLQGLSEMIQNADDAQASQVRVALLADGLWVAHDGKPIELEHVFGIAIPWITTKSHDAAATGRHGIGLMTLRSLSPYLQVHCPPYHVELAASALSPIDAASVPSWLAQPGWTLIHVPLAPKVVPLASMRDWIAQWGHDGLLFLRSVSRVALHDQTGSTICELRLRWSSEGAFTHEIAGEAAVVEVRRAQDPAGRAWRVHETTVASPEDINRFGKAKGARTPVAVALPLSKDQDHWLHAGLPVEKTDLPVRICAQFDTLSNRQGLASSAWNQWLVPIIGQLWLASIGNLLETEPKLAWRLIPLMPPQQTDNSSTRAALENEVHTLARVALAQEARVSLDGGEYAFAADLAVEVQALENVLDEEEVATLAGCDHALPCAVRDADRAWWDVLAAWRESVQDVPKPVSVEDALSLLDIAHYPVIRRIALAAVAIAQSLDIQLSLRPCVALANDSAVPPPQSSSPELLVASAGTLAEQLGIGMRLHPMHLADTPPARDAGMASLARRPYR